MSKRWLLWLVLGFVSVSVVACGERVDVEKPVEEVRGEVEDLSLKKLESKAMAYAEEINLRMEELDRIKAKAKSLAPKDLLGEKGAAIKEEMKAVVIEVKALKSHYRVYLDELKEKGGDLSKVQLS